MLIQLNLMLFHPENNISVLLRITAVQEFYCTHCGEQYTPCVLQRGTSVGALLRNWGRRWDRQRDITHKTETLLYLYRRTVSGSGEPAGQSLQIWPVAG